MKITVKTNQTLIDAIAELSPESSKTTLRSWLKDGRVTVDGIIVKLANSPVRIGQEIALGQRAKFIDEKIKVYYEDEHLIVIEKPAGLLSVSTDFEKSKTAHNILKKFFRPRKVFVVHRLDQDTSGVMMFAFTETACERLKAMLEKHDVERVYHAVVEGRIEEESGTWKSYLYEDPNYVVRSTEDKNLGQLAITHYEVEGYSNRNTALTLKLETGRKNQIRVHCKDAGHPILGDKKYGSTRDPIKRLCLHAHVLAFVHPMTHKKVRFESPDPLSFQKLYGILPNK